jgi:hypothetical protein
MATRAVSFPTKEAQNQNRSSAELQPLRIPISSVLSASSSSLHSNENGSSMKQNNSFFTNKPYIIICVCACLFYFLVVFIGMLQMNNSFQRDDDEVIYKSNKSEEQLERKAYNIIELVLLAVLSVDVIIKIVYTSKQSKNVKIFL